MRKYNFGYTPSSYQEKVFEAIETTNDSLAINAVAGSGKTTTIVSALKLIPKHKTSIFLAFNKSIVKELESRVPANVAVSTLHSYGCRMLMLNFGKISISENKVFNLGVKLSERWQLNTDESKYFYVGRVAKLVDFMRFNLVEDDIEHIEELADRYNIQIYGDEPFHAKQLLKESNKRLSEIDFADMIYLPAIKEIKMKTFDAVFIDEAQDLNRAQQTMVKKILSKRGRLVAVGDPMQSIYGFAGADIQSFDRMRNLNPGTKELPLSVCYRLTKSLVKHAQEIVPHILWSEKAEEGIDPRVGKIEEIQEKDFVLCRFTKPLVVLFIELLKQGKKANIKGREIGKSLITAIDKTKQTRVDKMLQHLKVKKIQIKSKLTAKGVVNWQEHPKMTQFEEMCQIIEILSQKFQTTKELKEYIDTVFLDENIPGIVLSTIHKAKGLEANKVFILNPELMPSPYAITAEEIQQEKNLMYVARTRAKKELIYIPQFAQDLKPEEDI